MSDRIYYAVGDIHGERDRLLALHEAIDKHWRSRGDGRPATVVHIGDYVDRGPDSYGVVDYLIDIQRKTEAHPGWEMVCLLGNHERMMIDAIETGEQSRMVHWLVNGGEATVASYRRAAPPGMELLDFFRAHVEWMKTLPTQLLEREAGLVFVHAGIQPDRFPECTEEVRLWTRAKKFMKDSRWPKNAKLDGLKVVHGHTPTEGEPYVGPRRINLDTGAVYGGPLTAAVFMDGAPPEFLFVRRETVSVHVPGAPAGEASAASAQSDDDASGASPVNEASAAPAPADAPSSESEVEESAAATPADAPSGESDAGESAAAAPAEAAADPAAGEAPKAEEGSGAPDDASEDPSLAEQPSSG